MSHPHTVYIFGSEEIAGMPVISMELLPGGTLKDRVDERGPLPFPEAVSAVLDILGGLDAAQAAGILHRDIKPSNCFTDGHGLVKVGDFGLSISTLARDVQAGAGPQGFQGTPQFAPPEQLRGEPLDVRADIYAVGATLYYLLTGMAPFEANSLRDLVERIATEPPPSPRGSRPDVPAALAAVVRQCLAKDPGARPGSYAALAESLRPFSAAGAAPARPGLRAAAGLVDALIIGLPVNILNTWRMTDASGGVSVRIDEWTGLITVIYYVLLEGTTGASLGKRLFKLRVAGADRPATVGQILVRTSVFCAPGILLLLVLGGVGRAGLVRVLTENIWLAVAYSLSTPAFVAALFLPVRRANGYAAVHDRVSGTRVVARPSPVSRQIIDVDTSAGSARPPLASRARCGPFEVLGDLGETGTGRLLAGFDPALRRRVWIHAVPPGTPPIGDVRREAGRMGRLHWLTGRRSADGNWDVYEAPDGRPVLRLAESDWSWPVASACLMDIATELVAAAEDGAMPLLGAERVWMRHDGHAVLLDFPAPGMDHGQRPGGEPPDDTPAGLLGAIAAIALWSLTSRTRGEPPLAPLSGAAAPRAMVERADRLAPRGAGGAGCDPRRPRTSPPGAPRRTDPARGGTDAHPDCGCARRAAAIWRGDHAGANRGLQPARRAARAAPVRQRSLGPCRAPRDRGVSGGTPPRPAHERAVLVERRHAGEAEPVP